MRGQDPIVQVPNSAPKRTINLLFLNGKKGIPSRDIMFSAPYLVKSPKYRYIKLVTKVILSRHELIMYSVLSIKVELYMFIM